jgi:hypothetical protein
MICEKHRESDIENVTEAVWGVTSTTHIPLFSSHSNIYYQKKWLQFKLVLCQCGIAFPQDATAGDALQIRRAAAKVLNQRTRSENKWSSSTSGGWTRGCQLLIVTSDMLKH